MATTQDDLIKALRGNSGREQVNFDLGQVGLRPTIQRGGQYSVQVQETPRTNSALQLADALKDSSALLNNFVELQSKQGEIEAGALSPQDVIKRVEEGDPNAGSFLDKLGKEKTFTENVYKRYFTSTVQPKLQALEQELKSRPVHEYADMGVTTPEDFQGYAAGRVKELTDEFDQYTSKSPYAQVLHNQLVEEVVPQLVQKQTAAFDAGITEFNKKEVLNNRLSLDIKNGVVLDPQATLQNGTQNTFRDKPRGTIYGFEKKGDATFDTNSSFAIGANASPQEQADIRQGKPSDAKLVANKDFALSPDLEEQFTAQGFKLRDMVTLTLEDGSTHTGRWMDRTAKEFQGKTLSGRVDIYSPNADSPVKDKGFVGFSRGASEAMTSFEDSVAAITQVNIDSYLNAKYSPSEASKIERENIVAQVKSLSTQGRFSEARKLQTVLENLKVGGQPLFGSADGKLQLVSLEDSIDRDEEQEYSQNERTAKKKVEEATAGVSLRLMRSTPETLEEDYEAVKAELSDRVGLTDSEKVSALKEIDQLYQNKASTEYTKATRSDNLLNKINAEGGSTGAFANFSNSAASEDRILGTIAGSQVLKEKAVINDPLTGRQAVNPAFVQQMRASITTLGAQKNLLNQNQTEMIMKGEGFTYDVNGKSVVFEGTNDPVAQKQLHLRLGQAFQEDLNTSLVKQLEADVQANPLFLSAPSDKPLTKYEQAYQNLINRGVPEDQAKTLATTEAQKGIEPVIVNGQPRINRSFGESPKEYVATVVTALGDTKITPEQSEALFNSAVFNNKTVVKENVKSFASNPIKNLKALDELGKSFEDVGIPWESVKSGHVVYSELEAVDFVRPGMAAGGVAQTSVERYFPITQYLKRPEAATKYKILPISVLRNKDTPDVKKAIEDVAAKYNMNYNDLVKGQEAWYASRNIKISK